MSRVFMKANDSFQHILFSKTTVKFGARRYAGSLEPAVPEMKSPHVITMAMPCVYLFVVQLSWGDPNQILLILGATWVWFLIFGLFWAFQWVGRRFLMRFGIEITPKVNLEVDVWSFRGPIICESIFCQKLTLLKRNTQNGSDNPRSIWPIESI